MQTTPGAGLWPNRQHSNNRQDEQATTIFMETTRNDRERNDFNQKTIEFNSLTTTKPNIDHEGLTSNKKTIDQRVNEKLTYIECRRYSLYDRTLNKLLRKLRPRFDKLFHS